MFDILNFEYTIPFKGDSKNIELWTKSWPLWISLSLLPGYPPQGRVGIIKPIADHSFIATVPYFKLLIYRFLIGSLAFLL